MSDAWRMPVLWPGATVAILASGPSMSREAAEQVRAAGLPAIAINNTFQLAPWAAMLYAADPEWWHRMPAAHDFAGLKVSVWPVKGVSCVTVTGLDGIDMTPGCVRTGGNSGYQALQLAMQGGARRVLLLGFDMHGTHWHGPHVGGLRNTEQHTFDKWVRRFDAAAPEIAALGVDVVNCCADSAISGFRKASLAHELQEVAACE